MLALFHGPHAYVSPSWYGVHPSVPTWNYAVVHARGRARLIEDPAALEDNRPAPGWRPSRTRAPSPGAWSCRRITSRA